MTTVPLNGARAVTDTATGEALALLPLDAADVFSMEQYLSSVASEVAFKQQQALAAAYDLACKALIGPNDVQKEGTREFKKKSAWRKLQRHFHIRTRVVSREFVDVVAKRSDREATYTTALVTVEARAPWGQTAEAIGACGYDEETGKRSITLADMVATAETRATNRAVSNLIAMGEVSAEEIGGRRTSNSPSSRGGNSGGGSGGSAPSDKQWQFAERLAKSSALTDDQRKIAQTQLAKAKAEGWDRQRFSKFIDKLKEKVDDAEGAPSASSAASPTATAPASGTTFSTTDAEPDFETMPSEDASDEDDDDFLPL